MQAPRCRPGSDLGGIPVGGLRIAASGGQHPEVGEHLVAAQLAALDLLGHPQAARPDLLGVGPVPGRDQIEQHHPPALDGIDGRALLAQLGEGRLKRSPELGHDPGAVRRERQQYHSVGGTRGSDSTYPLRIARTAFAVPAMSSSPVRYIRTAGSSRACKHDRAALVCSRCPALPE